MDKTHIPGRLRCRGVALSLTAALTACGGGAEFYSANAQQQTVRAAPVCSMSGTPPTVSSAPAPLNVATMTLLQVLPSDASSCVTIASTEPHYAVIDSAPMPRQRLAVFLPGTGATPSQYPAHLEHGATRGYHVIGLRYPNAETINALCNDNAGDANCTGRAREEVITGADLSPLVTVGRADSIEQRLADALRYLHTHRPADGWGQYLRDDHSVAWDRVLVAGHSQGGGHAAYIGRLHAVQRVGVYSSPSDYVNNANAYPTWFAMAGSPTGADRYYGYIHAPDPIANTRRALQVLNAWGDPSMFGMAGSVVNVENSAPPYGNSHRLTTSACGLLALPMRQHNCTMTRGHEPAWNVVSYP